MISILNLYKKHKKVFITSNAAFVGGAMVTKKRMGGASELWTWKLLTNSTSWYENLRETRSKKSKRHASCFIRLTSPASCLSVCLSPHCDIHCFDSEHTGSMCRQWQCAVLVCLSDTCDDSEYFLLPFCYTECPKHFYAVNETGHVTATCERCHSTCLFCSGRADNECLNCSIHRRLTVDHQCVDVDSHRRLSPLVIAAILTLPVAVLATTAVSVWLWLQRRRSSSNRSPSLWHCLPRISFLQFHCLVH